MAASVDFTVADVLAWARTKPADERYDVCKPRLCALAQFGMATGRRHLLGRSNPEKRFGIPDLNWALGFCESSNTFGDLVARLETLCPETPVTRSDWLSIETYLSVDCGRVPA